MRREKGAGINRDKVLARMPNSMVIPFCDKKKRLYDHVVYPDFGELFLTLLSWGWDIDFFSSGEKERNEMVVSAFIKYAFAPYCQGPEDEIKSLLDSRVRIFSRDHLKDSESILPSVERSYEVRGNKKKDLSVLKDIRDLKGIQGIDVPLSNIILIDDDLSYAIGGEQYPCLRGDILADCGEFYYYLNKEKALRNNDLFEFSKEFQFTAGAYPKNDYASFLLGILLDCKGLMENEKKSLREALKSVLKVGETAEWKGLGPCVRIKEDLGGNEEGCKKLSRWIEAGRKSIESTKSQRLTDDLQKRDIYNEIAREYYQTTKFEKVAEDGCIIM